MDIVPPSSTFPAADPAKRLDACPCDHRTAVRQRSEEQPDGCWRWLLRIDSDGYGRISHRDFAWLAHRFSYEAFVGRIPDGLQIDHLCRNRACVNPAHLEAVTPKVNTRRSFDARGITRDNRPRRQYLSRQNVTADDPRHGTRSGYINLKCRCEPCREANRLYQRKKVVD